MHGRENMHELRRNSVWVQWNSEDVAEVGFQEKIFWMQDVSWSHLWWLEAINLNMTQHMARTPAILGFSV